MIDLDDPEGFADVDPADALGATLTAPDRWGLAPQLTSGARVHGSASAVLVAGMGGSGIAGDVAAALAAGELAIPVLVHKDADLPAYVGPDVPVIVVSHSGRTAETRAVAAAACRAGAEVIAVTSGGPLAAEVGAGGGKVILVPEGGQARHALGALAGVVCCLLGLDDIDRAVVAQRGVLGSVGPHVPTARNPAKQLATAIAEVSTVDVWATSRLSAAAATRMSCQLEEHAKVPAATATLPELTHNEVAAWRGSVGGAAHRGLVVLRDPASETAVARDRVEPAVDLVRHGYAWVAERAVAAPGDGPLARLAALVLALDLTSVYAAFARGVDPTPISAIDELKAITTTQSVADGGQR